MDQSPHVTQFGETRTTLLQYPPPSFHLLIPSLLFVAVLLFVIAFNFVEMSCTLIYSPTGNATEDYTKKVVGDDGGAALQKKTIEAVTQRAM